MKKKRKALMAAALSAAALTLALPAMPAHATAVSPARESGGGGSGSGGGGTTAGGTGAGGTTEGGPGAAAGSTGGGTTAIDSPGVPLAGLPDPDGGGSPEQVTIEDNGVPLSYMRADLPDGSHVYVLDGPVPLGAFAGRESRSPQTSDGGGMAAALALISGAAALSALGMATRRREGEAGPAAGR